MSGREAHVCAGLGRHNLVQGTLKHFLVLEPILRRALVTQSRRNARQGVGISYEMLKVRANPSGKPSTRNKTRQVKVRVGEMVLTILLVCLIFQT